MKNQEYLDSFLTDGEKAAIGTFMQNDTMREAVKKVLLSGIYSQGTLKKGEAPDPLRNFAFGAVFNRVELSNDQIGAELRAAMSGMNSLESAFKVLDMYKLPAPKPDPKKNVAR